jgi:Mrp family chromosome partitioning ATPase
MEAIPTATVTFVPLPEPAAVRARAPLSLTGPPLAERLLHELGPSFTDLAASACGANLADEGSVVLLTGGRPGAGCSTIAWTLARAAAEQGPVLLMDGDLSGRGLSKLGEGSDGFGWTDALQGLGPFDQALRQVAGHDLAFLPLREPNAERDLILSHAALPLWLARLRREFRLIVLDGGPLAEGGAGWARWVDAALLVCDAGQTSAGERAQGWDQLEAGGTHVLGIVETFV